jgi:hypothetical protein
MRQGDLFVIHHAPPPAPHALIASAFRMSLRIITEPMLLFGLCPAVTTNSWSYLPLNYGGSLS